MRHTIIIAVLVLLSMSLNTVNAQMNERAIDHNPDDVERVWSAWQERYLEPVTLDGRNTLRVVSDAQTQVTFSEGQAYGMLFATLFDEQEIFDSLWAYAHHYLNRNGLMSWHIASDGSIIDVGAATDADMDMAMALIYACRRQQLEQWQESSIAPYCDSALSMINSMWVYEIDKQGNQPDAGLKPNPQGYEIIPGDLWCLSCDYPNGITNLSYFAPAYLQVFNQVADEGDWQAVIDRNYDILNQAQATACSGLVPNWNTYAGDPQEVSWQGETSFYWGWDAARVAWRLALSNYWYDDTRATTALNTIGGFFTDIGLNNVVAEYRLDGTAVNNYRKSYFTATAASAIWGMETPVASPCEIARPAPPITPDQAFQTVLRLREDDYYNDSWRLLSLLLMGGYFTRPDQDFVIANGATNLPVAESVPPTPTQPFTEPTATEAVATAVTEPTALPDIAVSQVVDVQLKTSVVNNQQAQFQIRVQNITNQDLNDLTLRIMVNTQEVSSNTPHVLTKYWDSSDSSLSALERYQGDIYYWDVSLDSALGSNQTWEVHLGINLEDWSSNLDIANDWWYGGIVSQDFATTQFIPVYNQGELVAGGLP